MKISIVVPTRNRAEYLPYCLATCLSPNDKHIEVIVSDNNSSDQTRQVISRISDSRLRYFNIGECLSMRQNFEFALSKVTGDYLMFIRTMFILTQHPHVGGRRSRIVQLDRLITYIKSKPGVWFATMEQVANYVKRSAD
jgi:GT2 family glycosyltransferase